MTDESARVAGERESADREHFDRIVSSYTRKDECESSAVARRFRAEATFGVLPETRNLDVLEVGCGAGFAVSYLGERFRRYHGIDHSAALIDVARSVNGAPMATFDCGRVQDLAFESEFDVAFVVGVLHHLEDVDAAVAAMIRALRPGGWLVVNEPQPNNPVVRLARRFRKRIDRSYSSDQIEFTSEELRTMFVKHELTSVGCRPQGYFSTPFAEVPLPLPVLSVPIAQRSSRVDAWLGSRNAGRALAWNCIAFGRKA